MAAKVIMNSPLPSAKDTTYIAYVRCREGDGRAEFVRLAFGQLDTRRYAMILTSLKASSNIAFATPLPW